MSTTVLTLKTYSIAGLMRQLRLVALEDQFLLGFDVLLLDQLVELGRRVDAALPGAGKVVLAAPTRLGHARHEPGDHHTEHREYGERAAPRREPHHHAGHQEPGAGTDQFAALDPTEHAAAHVGREHVADEGRDRWTSGGGEHTECDPRCEQQRERPRRGGEAHRHAPDADADHEDRDPAGPVGEDPDRDDGDRAHDREHAGQQPDLRVADVELSLQRRRQRAERGAVGAVECQHGRQGEHRRPTGRVAQRRLVGLFHGSVGHAVERCPNWLQPEPSRTWGGYRPRP